MDDEAKEYANTVAKLVDEAGGIAPVLFWYEVRNALIINERRGRIDSNETHAFLWQLQSLPIELRQPPIEQGIFELARTHELTVYDAAYLALAKRHNASIASLDKTLIRAAEAEHIDIVLPAI